MSESLKNLASDLAQFVSAALGDFRTRTTEQMEQFAVDCHPWNGVLALAFLTTKEAEESPFLADTREMAAWKLYDFASALSCSRTDLGSRMRALYEQTSGDRTEAGERFFGALAGAVASKVVQDQLSMYDRSDNFNVSIPHPDTGKEYYLSI